MRSDRDAYLDPHADPRPHRQATMIQRKRLALLLALLAGSLALCAPAAASATVTISPLPGTPTAMPGTQISFLGASARSLSSISVVGSRSGRHGGRLRSYASATGASFVPSKPFLPGERVVVHARVAGGPPQTLSTNFSIAVPQATLNQGFPSTPGTPADVQSYSSQPALHPPTVTVTQVAGVDSAPGYIFAAPFQGPGQYGPEILDNAGNAVWFHPLRPGEDATDFQTQSYRGRSVLTWWQGKTLVLGYGLGRDVIADSHYRTVATVRAGNGMPTDEHEFTILPNGAAVVVAYAPVRWNLAAAGGPRTGIALDCAVQEVDIRTGLVMWEWRSLGHVEVSQSYSPPPTSPTGYYDYFHVNSAQLLGDDSFLLSARNTWGVYDVNAHTGAIVWQLGGKASTFALGPGVQFAYQHNARLLPNGEVSVYDDEGAPPVNPPARGEVVKIDTSARTAVLASAFVRKPGLLTTCCGNVQQLSGDRWMVGWGGLPNFTEFDAEGNAIFDAQYPRGEFNYRVYRDTWKGQPLTPPSVLVKLAPAPSACPPGAKCPLQLGPTAYASWNGATEVTSWQLLAGSSARHMKAISTVPKTGFETEIPAPGRNTFYAVRALSSTGRVLGTSRIVRASAR